MEESRVLNEAHWTFRWRVGKRLVSLYSYNGTSGLLIQTESNESMLAVIQQIIQYLFWKKLISTSLMCCCVLGKPTILFENRNNICSFLYFMIFLKEIIFINHSRNSLWWWLMLLWEKFILFIKLLMIKIFQTCKHAVIVISRMVVTISDCY